MQDLGCQKGLRRQSSDSNNFFDIKLIRYLLTLNEVLLQHFLLIFIIQQVESMHKSVNSRNFYFIHLFLFQRGI